MLGIKSKKVTDEVLNHWIASADNFTLPPQEFYEAVEKQLATIKIPGLEISREEYAEGGLLSDKRVYLRMVRERLAFDVCAAPFGTRYFFSSRTVYSPVVVQLWHIIAVIALLTGVFYGVNHLLNNVTLSLLAVGGLVLAVMLMFRNVGLMGLHDVDALLLKLPAIGTIYERFFRKETYYRHDTRLMYLDTIPAIIEGLADEFTANKGVKLIRQYQIAPILGELYKPVPPRPPAAPEK